MFWFRLLLDCAASAAAFACRFPLYSSAMTRVWRCHWAPGRSQPSRQASKTWWAAVGSGCIHLLCSTTLAANSNVAACGACTHARWVHSGSQARQYSAHHCMASTAVTCCSGLADVGVGVLQHCSHNCQSADIHTIVWQCQAIKAAASAVTIACACWPCRCWG